MKKFLVFLSIALLLISCNTGFAENQPVTRDLVASLAHIPTLAESPDKGIYIDLIKAIDEMYPGKIKIEIYPFPRSVNNIIEDKADFHIPISNNPEISNLQLPYRVVAEKLSPSAFVIYSNINKIITKKTLNDALAAGGQFPYKIDVPAGIEALFRFPCTGFVSSEQSFRKIVSNRIDAIVCSQDGIDIVLKRLKFNKIHRVYYGDLETAIIVQKSPKGEEVDNILSYYLRKLKSSGRLQKILEKTHSPYNDWQPAKMGW